MSETNNNFESIDKLQEKENEASPINIPKEMSLSKCIMFGVFLGGCLGLLGSIICNALLQIFDRPDIIIRPGWETFAVIAMTFNGCFAGIFYGIFFRLILKKATQQILKIRLFLLTVLLGETVYIICDYISIKQMNASYFMIADLLVFIGSLGIAYLLSRKPSREEIII